MIVVVGLSHRTAPLAVRESLAFARDSLRDALHLMRQEASLGEAMILSTCNRVELYGRDEDPTSPEALEGFLCRYHRRSADEVRPYLYHHCDDEAVRHAFRVAASLESMVIGEPQILGQVKDAYQAAEEAGTLGRMLNALRNRSLASAKRVRTETGIGRNAVSVSYVAVELARKIFGELRDKNVLLVGAGKMSELAAKHLVRTGARATVLGGRTFERASELAAALGGRAAPFESLRAELAVADIVISGTGAPGIVITQDDVEAARAARRGRHARPLFLIDIAVPRDVDPGVSRIGGVFLYDLDDLKSVAEANLRERLKEASAAEAMVEREVREFLDWQRSREAVPLLVELRRKADEIRRAELEKARKRLGPLTPEQEEALEAATSAIVNKLLHSPTVHLKEAARDGHGPEHMSLHPQAAGVVSQNGPGMKLRIGTRASALALWQAKHVQGLLAARGHEVDILRITTTGDKVLDRRLESIGGKGAFLKEIEEAMLAGQVDLAVHSLKDVPTQLPKGLMLCAYLERADPRDGLLSNSGKGLEALPHGARLGTTSLRRGAQIKALRPDLHVDDLRGNVDTRIRRLRERHYDAIVLAMAGLTRLGRQDEVTQVLDPQTFIPAPGQGAIALECREGEAAIRAVAAELNHERTARAVAAERAFLAAVRGRLQRAPRRPRHPRRGRPAPSRLRGEGRRQRHPARRGFRGRSRGAGPERGRGHHRLGAAASSSARERRASGGPARAPDTPRARARGAALRPRGDGGRGPHDRDHCPRGSAAPRARARRGRRLRLDRFHERERRPRRRGGAARPRPGPPGCRAHRLRRPGDDGGDRGGLRRAVPGRGSRRLLWRGGARGRPGGQGPRRPKGPAARLGPRG